MATVVEIETVEGFILDDPVAGVLGNAVYTLGGSVFTDITDQMIDLSIARGKSRDLDRFSSGALNIVLNNETRLFDPLYTSGALYNQIIPRRAVRITTDGLRQFTGVIDDWNFGYNPGGQSKAEIIATDDFTLLARQTYSGTSIPQATGARVSAVLDSGGVAWSSDRRDISPGVSELEAETFSGNALEYLQKVETSEQGALFIAKDGDLTFLDRSAATPTSDSLVTFADDGTGIGYTRVNVNYGIELLVNNVTVSSGVGTGSANNERSEKVYGISSEDLDTFLGSQPQLDNMATFIVSKYADPEYRFESVSMNLDTMSAPNKATVLGLELGDVIVIKFTPNGIGNQILQYGEIIKLDHEIEQIRHDVTIGVSALDWTFLVLDDSVFGTIDVNHLGF